MSLVDSATLSIEYEASKHLFQPLRGEPESRGSLATVPPE